MSTAPVDRRHVLGAGLAIGTVALGAGRASAGSAHRFTEGDFEITVLSDGYLSIPDEILLADAGPAERAAVLGRIDASGGVFHPPCNIPLIRSGEDLILVDIGSGRKYQPTDGRLTGNLRAAGVDPGEITKVVFTHGHPDHVWATLSDDGALRFPNAQYFVGAGEWDFWTDPDYLTTMPAPLHEFAKGAQRDLSAVKERARMLRHGDDVVTVLRALDTPGHTPGHLSFELAGRDGLLIAADVANNEVVSFEHPDWSFGYDTLPDLAIKTRMSLLDRVATDRIRLLGYHWTYPGVGYAERRGGAYRFVRAD